MAFIFFLCQQKGKNRGVEKSGNSIIRSVKERKNIALGEENMLFAIEKCIRGNRRSVARENKLPPACWDRVNRGTGTEEALQSSTLENKTTRDTFSSHTHSTYKMFW